MSNLSPSCCLPLVGFLLLLGPGSSFWRPSWRQMMCLSVMCVSGSWRVCGRVSVGDVCVSPCQRVSSCLRVSGCVRSASQATPPPTSLRRFSTADSSQPTPEGEGAAVSFHPQRCLNILRPGMDDGGSGCMSPHDCLVRLCVCMGVPVSCEFVR